MKVWFDNLEDFLEWEMYKNEPNDTITYKFFVGDYSFVATFDIFQSFAILVHDEIYKIIDTYPNPSDALSSYNKYKEIYSNVALIKL